VPNFVYRINSGSEKDGVMTAMSNQIRHSHIRAYPENSVLSRTSSCRVSIKIAYVVLLTAEYNKAGSVGTMLS